MANILKYSQHLMHNTASTVTTTAPWLISGQIDIAPTAIQSIYGNSVAYRFSTNSTGGPFQASMEQSLGSQTAGAVLTLSVTVAHVDSDIISLGFNSGSWLLQNFNIVTDAIGSAPDASVTNAAIEDLGGGIVRLSATYTVPTTGTVSIGIFHSDTLTQTSASSSFASTISVDIHGIQCEVGASVTPYLGTTWASNTLISTFASGATGNWSNQATWQSGEVPLAGDSVLLNAGPATTPPPLITVDVPVIPCTAIIFSTSYACRLLILNDCVINSAISLSGAYGTYYNGLAWEGGNLTINGNISWAGMGTVGSTVARTHGIFTRVGSFPSGTLTFNGTVLGNASGAYAFSGLLNISNSDPSAVDTIQFNANVTLVRSTSNPNYPIIYFTAGCSILEFNGTTTFTGNGSYGSNWMYDITASNCVLSCRFNGPVIVAGEYGMYADNTGCPASARGVDHELVINNTLTTNNSVNYGVAATITRAVLRLTATGKIITQGNLINSFRLYSYATLIAHPDSVITSTSGAARTVPTIYINNNASHIVGTIDASPSSSATISYNNTTTAGLVSWIPVAPALGNDLYVDKIISGNSVGLYIGSTVDSVKPVINQLITLDPALATASTPMPGVYSTNPYCTVRFKSITQYQYAAWLLSARMEPYDNSSSITMVDSNGVAQQFTLALSGAMPNASDVREGVAVAAGVGTLVVPQAATVTSGIVYDNGTIGTAASADLSVLDAPLAAIQAKTDLITDTSGSLTAITSGVVAIKAQTDQLVFLPEGVKATNGVSVGETSLAADLAELDTLLDEVKTKTDTLTFTTGVSAKSTLP